MPSRSSASPRNCILHRERTGFNRPFGLSLSALEPRRALLEEGVQALLGVLGSEREIERAPFVLEPERERALVRAVDRLLGEPDPHGPLRGDRARHALRLLE